jgi:hypothetical protein
VQLPEQYDDNDDNDWGADHHDHRNANHDHHGSPDNHHDWRANDDHHGRTDDNGSADNHDNGGPDNDHHGSADNDGRPNHDHDDGLPDELFLRLYRMGPRHVRLGPAGSVHRGLRMRIRRGVRVRTVRRGEQGESLRRV